jgi:uncharacterized C2H2 Zn-finger protein
MDQHQVCELLQQAILDFCQQNISSWSSDIEVDGIICISPKNSTDHHVVKIHERLHKVFADQGRTTSIQQHDEETRNINSIGMDVNFEQNGQDASCMDMNSKTIATENSREISPSFTQVMNGDVAIVNLENSVVEVEENMYLHAYNKDSNGIASHFDNHSKNRRKLARKSPPSQILSKLLYDNKRNSDLESDFLPSTPDIFQIGNQHNENRHQDWSITKNTGTDYVEESPVIKKETTENINCDSHIGPSDQTNLMQNNSKPILPLNIVQTGFSPVISRELEHSCKFCGKQFSFKCTKVRHERNSCGKNVQTLYTCEMCEKVFSRSDSRVRHMIKAHGMTPLNAMNRRNKQTEIQER